MVLRLDNSLAEMLGPGAVVVVAELDAHNLSTEVDGNAVSNPVSITFFNRHGELIRGPLHGGRPLDIRFQSPKQARGRNVTCVFWNEQLNTWSSDGVYLGAGPSPDGTVLCKTNHLSIFGLLLQDILKQFECINVKIFSSDTMWESLWWTSPAAVIVWCMLVFMAGMLSFFMWTDARNRSLWRDEFFLAELVTQEKAEPGMCLLCWLAATTMKRNMRALVHALCGLSRRRPSLDDLQAYVMVTCMRARMSSRSGLSPRTISEHIWNSAGYVHGDVAQLHSKALKVKAQGLKRELYSVMQEVRKGGVFKNAACLLRAEHPMLSPSRFTIEITAAKQFILFVSAFLGSLCVCVLYFHVTGGALSRRSSESCQRGLHFGRVIAIGVVSTFVAAVPAVAAHQLSHRHFLNAAHWDEKTKQAQVRLWRTADVVVRFYEVCYCGLCLYVVIAFLADLSDADQIRFTVTFATILVRWFIGMPLLRAFGYAATFEGLARINPSFFRDKVRLKRMDIDIERPFLPKDPRARSSIVLPQLSEAARDKTIELGNRGVSLRHLLELYASLCEVMPMFDAELSTTSDVVRHAIIPRTAISFTLCRVRVNALEGLQLHQDNGTQNEYDVPTEPGGLTFVCEVLGKPSLTEASASVASARWPAFGAEMYVDQYLKGDSLTVTVKYGSDVLGVATIDGEEVGLEGFSGKVPLEGQSRRWQRSPERKTNTEKREGPQLDLAVSLGPRADQETPAWGPRGGAVRDEEKRGFAYASVAAGFAPKLASKMVTHNWTNKFSHLVAAVVADGLQLEKFDLVLEQLLPDKIGGLIHKLEDLDVLDDSYWICALSVNQHCTLCHRMPAAKTDSQGCEVKLCDCSTPKVCIGDLSEVNKFDDMMCYLQATVPGFAHVIAVDQGMDLFNRIWCIAELAEANRLYLEQAIKVHSRECLEANMKSLMDLDVSRAEASRQEDKEFIMRKIGDVDKFNKTVRDILLHRDHGLITIFYRSMANDVAGLLAWDLVGTAVAS